MDGIMKLFFEEIEKEQSKPESVQIADGLKRIVERQRWYDEPIALDRLDMVAVSDAIGFLLCEETQSKLAENNAIER